MTRQSEYDARVETVSSSDSPFCMEDTDVATETTCPPRRYIAAAKEQLVLVLASKKILPITRPRRTSSRGLPLRVSFLKLNAKLNSDRRVSRLNCIDDKT